MKHPLKLATALLILFVLACAAAPGEHFEDPPAWADAPQIEAAVDFAIGSDEPGPYLFSQIYGLALDTAGRIYLAEAQANEVRVFGPTGVHLYSIGRTGSGPGELKRPCCLAFDPDGRLWVQRTTAAGEPARADIYDPDGTPAVEVTWPRGVSLSNGAMRGDGAVGIAYDEMGVPRLVALRLERR